MAQVKGKGEYNENTSMEFWCGLYCTLGWPARADQRCESCHRSCNGGVALSWGREIKKWSLAKDLLLKKTRWKNREKSWDTIVERQREQKSRTR